MTNKFIIPIAVVLFLIIEAVAILTKQMLLEEAANKAAEFSVSAPENLPTALMGSKTKKLTLT